MALPKLRADGTLPPGTHRATLAELTTAFDQANSAARPALSLALRHAVALIRAVDAAAIIYVGGSYVTDKRDPSDLDLAVRSDIWSDAAFNVDLSAAYPNETLRWLCSSITQATHNIWKTSSARSQAQRPLARGSLRSSAELAEQGE
jgi:hypothetical protein